jgi:hypothetical protein
MPPISLGIGLSLSMQGRGGKAWKPFGYAFLRYRDANGAYRDLRHSNGGGIYRPLLYKKEA